jgi:hypothetical protein
LLKELDRSIDRSDSDSEQEKLSSMITQTMTTAFDDFSQLLDWAVTCWEYDPLINEIGRKKQGPLDELDGPVEKEPHRTEADRAVNQESAPAEPTTPESPEDWLSNVSGQGMISRWDHYAEASCTMKDEYPFSIRILQGWARLMEAQLCTLKRIEQDCPYNTETSSGGDLDTDLWSLHKTLVLFHQDVEDVLEFASRSLPHDPWIQRRVDELRARCAEMTGRPDTPLTRVDQTEGNETVQ